MKDRQYRTLPFETPAQEEKKNKFDSDCYVEGYAAKYERYVLFDFGEQIVYEEFMPDCFRDCDMSDIIFQFDHSGRVYARKSNNTLTVEPDFVGLFICADLSKTSAARSMYEDIQAGNVTKMSWGFMPDYDTLEVIEQGNEITLRHHHIKKIYDVSAVSLPANDNTEIQARSFANGVIDKALKEIQKRKNHIKRIKLLMEVAK
jgi:HK97 family phage prohead protease